MLSAPAVKKAEDAINEARKAITELLKSREWDTMEEANALHSILHLIDRADVDFVKLECIIYGFDLWKYLTEDAIKAETWKDLEAKKKSAEVVRRKRSANQHCQAMGLEIPYPEVTE